MAVRHLDHGGFPQRVELVYGLLVLRGLLVKVVCDEAGDGREKSTLLVVLGGTASMLCL